MRKIETNDGMLFISQQIFQEYQTNAKEIGIELKQVIEDSIEKLFLDRVTGGVTSFFKKWKKTKEGVAILDAHGHREKGTWFFHDGKQKRTVQSWINGVDGTYGTLVLLVCDESVIYNLPKTKSSILFLPDGIVRGGGKFKVFGLEHHFSLIHQTYGEIDDYTVEDAERKLLTIS